MATAAPIDQERKSPIDVERTLRHATPLRAAELDHKRNSLEYSRSSPRVREHLTKRYESRAILEYSERTCWR